MRAGACFAQKNARQVPSRATAPSPRDNLEEEICMKENIELTICTSYEPLILTKQFRLENGVLIKSSTPYMQSGEVRRSSVENLHQLAELLDQLTLNQAVIWGLASGEYHKVVTSKNLPNDGSAIARTRDFFCFHRGPGILMLDHDGIRKGELGCDELRDQLIEACPPLEQAPMLWRPSASAWHRQVLTESR